MAMLATPEPIAEPMLPRRYRLARRRRETADTFTLELEPAVADESWRFRPGQFNMLYLPAIGEVPLSMSGDPAAPLPVLHTLRSVGAVTAALCALKPGAELGLRGPFGSSWPLDQAVGRDLVIVAGGIGLAPLRPAVYEAIARRREFGRVVLLYGARSPDELLYKRELQRWGGRFDLDVHVTVDYAADGWNGDVGFVTRLVHRAGFDAGDALVLICGPEVMMRYCVRELDRRGVAGERIYLSMERNMKCAIGFCGHCQFGPLFVCKDGPVLGYPRLAPYLYLPEL